MYSQAGKNYEKTRVCSPYNTRQRFKNYQLQPIKSIKKIPKHYQAFQTDLREKQDSFLLRYAKDITLNTNHSPNYQVVLPNSPRHIFAKASLERYIGDIRNQDFSMPLQENCDPRCAKANGVVLKKQVSTASSKISNILQMKQSQLETASVQKQQRLNSQIDNSCILSLSNRLNLSEIKSTEPSICRKRSKLTIQTQRKSSRKIKLKALSFDSSIGHRYLKQLEEREPLPEFYSIQQSKESFVKNSFKEPRIHVKFGLFRNKIACRSDRIDPYWSSLMNTDSCDMSTKDLSYNFNHYSCRKLNEVKNKYPYRGSMHLYLFPIKEIKA